MRTIALLTTAFLLLCLSIAAAQFSAPLLRDKKISEKSKGFHIDISYPMMTESAHREGMEKLNALVHNYFQEQIKQFRSDFKLSEGAGPADVPWSLNYSYEIRYKSPSLVSILFCGSNFCGGAHPTPIFYCVNFDLVKAKTVVMKDIFVKGSGYYEKLSLICIKELKKRDISSNSETINEGASPKAENFECFYFSSDALVVVFPPYQVAPYVAGEQEVAIPYSSISALIDKNGPAGHFVHKGK